MRAYGISVGILAAILVFSLWNSSYMTAKMCIRDRSKYIEYLYKEEVYGGR